MAATDMTMQDHLRDLLNAGEFRLALGRAHAALSDQPGNGDLWYLAAAAAQQLGAAELAMNFSLQAVALLPDNAAAHAQLGALCLLQGDPKAAVRCYRQASVRQPRDAAHHAGLGLALWTLRDLPAAEQALQTARRLNPKEAVPRNLLGVVQDAMGNKDAALATWQALAKSAPHYLPARVNLMSTYMTRRDYPRALRSCEHAICLDPQDDDLLTTRIYLKKKMADWSAHDDFRAWRADRATCGKPADPWSLLALADDPAAARQQARAHADSFATLRHRPQPRPADGRIRLGYVTSDVMDHATLHLLTGVLEHHDPSRFEVHLIALNAPDNAAITRRAMAATRAHRLNGQLDDQILDLLRGLHLDIAVDLKGFTQEARPQLFCAGIAPVQINYLGYPGTLSGSGWDYLIADSVLIPRDWRGSYDEAVIYLPDSYQPTDNRRAVPPLTTSRADHGLPDTAVVLCCFNDPYKLSPREFDIWAALLRDNQNTVLWLLASNPWAEQNLRREAAARGLDRDRLIFAPKVPQQAHLERQQHADLFLDSFNYTAHTTASDALWMGLPVLTLQGRQFAARVSASLLTAAGLPDLIAGSVDDYQAKARDLLRNPARLRALRGRVLTARDTSPLFDTARYTRKLEAGYATTVARCRAGLPPQDIRP